MLLSPDVWEGTNVSRLPTNGAGVYYDGERNFLVIVSALGHQTDERTHGRSSRSKMARISIVKEVYQWSNANV